MKNLDSKQIQQSLINVNRAGAVFKEGRFMPSDSFCQEMARLLEQESGYVVFYGTRELLERYQLDIQKDLNTIYEFYETLFKQIMSHIDMDKYNVINRNFTFAKMDVDGYKVNQNFSFDGKVAGRKFITTKCIHFDTSTPFIANIYGPNKNISGGYPLISDIKKYCQDKKIKPKDIIINIPDNYNIAIKEQYYADILNNYSFCLKMNLDTDVVMVMLSNEVEFGVAHGATDPTRTVADQESLRPIRHFEYQYEKEEHYAEWLEYYNVAASVGRDYDGKINLSLNYYNAGIDLSDNIIEVRN